MNEDDMHAGPKTEGCRPKEILSHLFHDTARDLGKVFNELHANRGKKGFANWANRCPLPCEMWVLVFATVFGITAEVSARIMFYAAIFAWRYSQVIIRLHPALYRAVIETENVGKVALASLPHLPFWSQYLETPGLKCGDMTVHGVFATQMCSISNQQDYLSLVFDTDEVQWLVQMQLDAPSLDEAIDNAFACSPHGLREAVTVQGVMPRSIPNDAVRATVHAVVSILLYLCSENAEIGSGNERPKNPEPKRTKRGMRLFPADRPATWDVGLRLGSRLQLAWQPTARESPNQP